MKPQKESLSKGRSGFKETDMVEDNTKRVSNAQEPGETRDEYILRIAEQCAESHLTHGTDWGEAFSWWKGAKGVHGFTDEELDKIRELYYPAIERMKVKVQEDLAADLVLMLLREGKFHAVVKRVCERIVKEDGLEDPVVNAIHKVMDRTFADINELVADKEYYNVIDGGNVA